MKQLKVIFKNSQDALKFVDVARTSDLYQWDADELERDIILNYTKPLPLGIKNTKTWYYDTDVEADFNKWISYMTLAGYALQIKMITKPSKRFPPKGI
jgi:hypothetical protein